MKQENFRKVEEMADKILKTAEEYKPYIQACYEQIKTTSKNPQEMDGFIDRMLEKLVLILEDAGYIIDFPLFEEEYSLLKRGGKHG
jgi:hypothetical protein